MRGEVLSYETTSIALRAVSRLVVDDKCVAIPVAPRTTMSTMMRVCKAYVVPPSILLKYSPSEPARYSERYAMQ
jgi:hypothetical protein